MKNTNESGKTFVEIVKTIIIVGITLLILFVVGRLLFRVVFEDSVAESTIKELSSRAITASTRFIKEEENLTGSEFGDRTKKGYPVLTYRTDPSFFEITLVGVPQAVCKRISNKSWRMPTSVYVNGNLSEGEEHFCSDINLMSFEFSRDLRENIPNSEKPKNKHCRTDSDCSGCEVCQGNLCKTGCNQGEKCSFDLKGNTVCCSSVQNADSICCSYVEDGNCCWGRNKCCPFDNPILLSDGTCTNCYDTKPFSIGNNASLDTCQKLCPNRVPFGADELCMLPICTNSQFMSRDGGCVDCMKEGAFKTSRQECAKCPKRIYQEGWCSLPCPENTVQDISGVCIPCNELSAVSLNDNGICTKSCPNRMVEKNKCILRTCPEGMILDQKGDCVSCQAETSIYPLNPDDCATCPNRERQADVCQLPCGDGFFRTLSGLCVPCSAKEAFPVASGSGECLKCPNRMGLENYCFAPCGYGEFRDSMGACRSCLDLNSYLVPETAVCSRCPYRSILLKHEEQGNKLYCKLQQCPLDYFIDQDGSCHDCFSNEVVANVSKENCEACLNRMWSPENQICFVRPTCPKNTFTDGYGKCHDCADANSLISVRGNLEECDKCPNRYVYGHWCRQCPSDVQSLDTKEACQKCQGKWDNRIQKCMSL